MQARGVCLAAALIATGLVWVQRMPDGSGNVQTLSSEQLQRLAGSTAALSALLDRDPGHRLRDCRHEVEGDVLGPESVAPLPNGSVLVLDRYGLLYRADPSPAGALALSGAALANVGPGRPLGYELAADGRRLVVGDSLKGLVLFDLDSGDLRVLSNGHTYVNDVATMADGTVYFTSSTEHPSAWACPTPTAATTTRWTATSGV